MKVHPFRIWDMVFPATWKDFTGAVSCALSNVAEIAPHPLLYLLGMLDISYRPVLPMRSVGNIGLLWPTHSYSQLLAA
jgi:hypothetical protein